MLGRLLVLTGLLMATCLPSAQAAKRIALVVGNDAYQSLPKLQKAVNDARAVGAALKDIGFEVETGENLTRREMNRRLADLEASIAPGDQVFFFYAGHGVAIASANLLLPVDMPAPKQGEESLVVEESLSADSIIQRIQARGAAVAFVVLDACRDNPFAAGGTRGIGATRGLARLDAPSGVFVLFSAGIGQTALDRLSDGDPDPNSVFTRKLVPLLRSPGLSHVAIAKRVQGEVIDLAATVKHKQEPAYYDQVKGEIVLMGGERAIAVEPASPQPPLSEEARVWPSIEGTASCGILGDFIRRFDVGRSVFVDFARTRQQELGCGEAQIAAVVPAQPAPADSGGCNDIVVKVGNGEDCLRPGAVFRDCPECPEMMVVPAGRFMMGSKDQFRAEIVHEVEIARPFAVTRFEVTVDQYAAFVSASGYEFEEKCWTNENEQLAFRSRSFRKPGFPQTGSHPATCLSWIDAKAYVKWLSERNGQDYRLLSEAEWEYAARAGTTSAFSFGDGEGQLCEHSNNQDQTAKAARPKLNPITDCEDGFVYTSPVGTFAPNAFGLHDMHGNLAEWVEDCLNDSYQGAPADGSTWTIAIGGVCINGQRGGSWADYYGSQHVAYRGFHAPHDRQWDYGLRVTRTLAAR